MICDKYTRFADFYLIQKFITEKYNECHFVESHQVFCATNDENKQMVFLPKYSGNSDDNNNNIIAQKIQFAASLKNKMQADLVLIKVYGDLICLTDDTRDHYFFINPDKN